jgi:hypothetical protein
MVTVSSGALTVRSGTIWNIVLNFHCVLLGTLNLYEAARY